MLTKLLIYGVLVENHSFLMRKLIPKNYKTDENAKGDAVLGILSSLSTSRVENIWWHGQHASGTKRMSLRNPIVLAS